MSSARVSHTFLASIRLGAGMRPSHEELGNAEAAASMGVGVGTLEQLLVGARRRLRAELIDLMEE